MPVYLDIEAFIEVEGKALEEYGVTLSPGEPKSHTCWIAGDVGQASCIVTHRVIDSFFQAELIFHRAFKST